jgi:hypothetical protein
LPDEIQRPFSGIGCSPTIKISLYRLCQLLKNQTVEPVLQTNLRCQLPQRLRHHGGIGVGLVFEEGGGAAGDMGGGEAAAPEIALLGQAGDGAGLAVCTEVDGGF